MVLTTDERKHALRILRAAARVEAAKAFGEKGDADAADAALAVEVRAQISLFHFELAAAANPGKPSAVEVSKAMPPLCDAAREALAARGARAFAPDKNSQTSAATHEKALRGNAAAGDAFAALASVFASLVEAQYAARAVEPGAAAAAARKKLRGRSGELLREEQASNLVLERASEALATIQQLVARADNPFEALPPGNDDEDDVSVAVAAPSPLVVLELHERLHGALADCRCCCGSFQRGAFLRASLPRLAAARDPIAAEAKRLRLSARARDDERGAEAEASPTKAARISAPSAAPRGKKKATAVTIGGTHTHASDGDLSAKDVPEPFGDEADGEGSPTCPGLGDSSSESEGEEDGGGGGLRSKKNQGKTAAEMEAEAEGAANGFVHYGGDVYCKSTRRAGSDAFDLSFCLFDAEGRHYAFRDCDATGKHAPGKEVHLLRSKVAVARYLERDGVSGADAGERDAALREAREKAEERAKEKTLEALPETDRRNAEALPAPAPARDENENENAGERGPFEATIASEPVPPPTRLEAVECLLERFDKALSQCMFCLYGVELTEQPRRCREEGGARSASNLTTPEACAEVWRHVQPLIASPGADPSSRPSASFARVLEKVRRAFPPESAAPIDGDPVERYLSLMPDFADGDEDAFGVLAYDRGDDAVKTTTALTEFEQPERSADAPSRAEEMRLAVAATTRAPPSAKALAAAREEEDAAEEEDDDAEEEGEGELAKDAEAAEAAEAEATEEDAEGDAKGPSLAANPLPDPRNAISPEGENEDPAATYAFVHKTLHRFVNAADAAENQAAYESVADTFEKVLLMLGACFPNGAPAVALPEAAVNAAGVRTNRRVAPSLDAAGAARRAAALLKADLVHNPADYDAWLALVDHIDQTKDMALNDAAKLVPCETWSSSRQAARAAAALRLALRRACCAAVASARTDDERVAAY